LSCEIARPISPLRPCGFGDVICRLVVVILVEIILVGVFDLTSSFIKLLLMVMQECERASEKDGPKCKTL
jgi:hypothetical protein